MAGLDKITNQIIEEARTQAEEILKEARAQADSVLAEARAESEKAGARIQAKGEADAAAYASRAESSAELKRRTALLQVKQELIAALLEKAYERLCALDHKEYFAFLEKAVERYALPRKGRLVLSAGDLQRMPAGFPDRVQQLARAKGGDLMVDEKPGEIENGFVMVYGSIEENCTLRAMFDSNRDRLQDAVHSLLFAGNVNP